MILTAIDSFILLFIVYFTGFAANNILDRFFSFHFVLDFFETVLFGLMACFIYFNFVSFFTAVNYFTLAPLLLPGIAGFILYYRQKRSIGKITSVIWIVLTGPYAFFCVILFALLFVFWIVPPFNIDSSGYHYMAIRWYEQYKVVPGLANIHGRLAFNPASFIISAAFSFTTLTGQSLYPLNGVLVFLFYGWMLKKIMAPYYSTNYKFLLLLCAIILFRNSLANISSPSSDLLATLLLFYCALRTYELITDGQDVLLNYLPVCILACFAATAKISTIPALLLLLCIFFVAKERKNAFILFLRFSCVIILLVAPWLIRNIILSGYLLYPLPKTNFLALDWAIPSNFIQMEYFISKYGPRSIESNYVEMSQMGFYDLTVLWFKTVYTETKFDLAITLFSFFSILTWLLFPIYKIKIPAKVFLLWCVYYSCLLIWFINSPSMRFGLSYTLACIFIPLFELARHFKTSGKFYIPTISVVMLIVFSYYMRSTIKHHYFSHYLLSKNWLLPAQDNRYATKNNQNTFPYKLLANGVKLYYADSSHECLNADGPCTPWPHAAIEMRGKKIEDGFRITKNELEK